MSVLEHEICLDPQGFQASPLPRFVNLRLRKPIRPQISVLPPLGRLPDLIINFTGRECVRRFRDLPKPTPQPLHIRKINSYIGLFFPIPGFCSPHERRDQQLDKRLDLWNMDVHSMRTGIRWQGDGTESRRLKTPS